MDIELEFQKYIIRKHITQFIVLIMFLILTVLCAIYYFHMDKTMAAYVLIGVLTSLLASLVLVYPESREHFMRGQYRLLAIAEMAAATSRDLSAIIDRNVLIEPAPSDEELRKAYLSGNPKKMERDARAFLLSFKDKFEVLVLSSPELEVSDWGDLYHAKRDLDVQLSLPAGANDIIFLTKALRIMDRVGQDSAFLMDYISRPGQKKD